MEVRLKNGNYLDYGNKYYIEYKYDNKDEQEKIYDTFKNVLLPAYGSNSLRSQHGNEYLKPFFVDKYGNITNSNTGIIGGTNIPEDLLTEFIRRYVEIDGITVRIGNESMKGHFNLDRFKDMTSRLAFKVELNKGDFLNYGDCYYVKFKYGNRKQQDKIFNDFDYKYIPEFGANSDRAKRGEEYIIPYTVDKNGKINAGETGIIGGCAIPEDLLPYFIKKFVNENGATFVSGDEEMRDSFDTRKYTMMISKLNRGKVR